MDTLEELGEVVQKLRDFGKVLFRDGAADLAKGSDHARLYQK
jgi:hypothetical protein